MLSAGRAGIAQGSTPAPESVYTPGLERNLWSKSAFHDMVKGGVPLGPLAWLKISSVWQSTWPHLPVTTLRRQPGSLMVGND
jgi:hypothetical protein